MHCSLQLLSNNCSLQLFTANTLVKLQGAVSPANSARRLCVLKVCMHRLAASAPYFGVVAAHRTLVVKRLLGVAPVPILWLRAAHEAATLQRKTSNITTPCLGSGTSAAVQEMEVCTSGFSHPQLRVRQQSCRPENSAETPVPARSPGKTLWRSCQLSESR